MLNVWGDRMQVNSESPRKSTQPSAFSFRQTSTPGLYLYADLRDAPSSFPLDFRRIMDLTPALGAFTLFSKTVSESDVYLFAGITGDFAPNHVNEQFMRDTQYGRRIAHGALLVGYMSTTSTKVNALMAERVSDIFPVSLGYDRVRFLKPVFIGDTITVSYLVESIDAAKNRSLAKVEVSNDRGEVVAAATHLMKWLPRHST
jgi:3-hydroxybutyryl-CoA dehydratase